MTEAATVLPIEAAAALRTTLPAPYFTLGQEPWLAKVLCNKIIVHIGIIVHDTIPMIIEYDDTHLKQKNGHRRGPRPRSHSCWSSLRQPLCLYPDLCHVELCMSGNSGQFHLTVQPSEPSLLLTAFCLAILMSIFVLAHYSILSSEPAKVLDFYTEDVLIQIMFQQGSSCRACRRVTCYIIFNLGVNVNAI